MSTNNMGVTTSDWEELQRDCHPFPAYIDYVQGRLTPFEIAWEREKARQQLHPTQQQVHKLKIATNSHSPTRHFDPQGAHPANPQAPVHRLATLHKPAANSSSSQIRQGFLHKGEPPAVQPPAKLRGCCPDAPSYVPSGPLSQPNPPLPVQGPVQILRRNEILLPQYVWFPERTRYSVNQKVNDCYDVLGDARTPPDIIKRAEAFLQTLSVKVSQCYTIHLKRETTKRNIETEMPRIFMALKTKHRLPSGHPLVVETSRYLNEVIGRLGDDMKAHVNGYMRLMLEAEKVGCDPLDVLPAHVRKPGKDAASLRGLGEILAAFPANDSGLGVFEAHNAARTTNGFGMFSSQEEYAGIPSPDPQYVGLVPLTPNQQHGALPKLPDQRYGAMSPPPSREHGATLPQQENGVMVQGPEPGPEYDMLKMAKLEPKIGSRAWASSPQMGYGSLFPELTGLLP